MARKSLEDLRKDVFEKIKKHNRVNVDYARERAEDLGLEKGGMCLEDFCNKKALDDDYFCFDCGLQ